MPPINNDWKSQLKPEYAKEYYRELYIRVNEEYKSHQIFPPSRDIFNAFHLTPLKNVKVVIIGQDPYHNTGQAHGLCFSVNKGIDIPPSLLNIYQELKADVAFQIPDHGCLTEWAEQGVLLLNTILTVRAHEPLSHKNIGWEQFTDAAIRILNKEDRPICFMLWGGPARAKRSLLDNPRHLILEAPHPSPLSAYRGFFGCRHFSRANDFLVRNGLEAIDWQIH